MVNYKAERKNKADEVSVRKFLGRILDMTEQTLYNYKSELNCQQQILTNQDLPLEVVKFGTWWFIFSQRIMHILAQ